MAQYDTGLGWSAKAEWLTAFPGDIAHRSVIGGAAYPGQPLPKNLAVLQDVISGGLRIFEYTEQYAGSIWYAASPDSSNILAAAGPITPGSGNYRDYIFWFISSAACTVNIGQKATGQYGTDHLLSVPVDTQDPQTGLYYGVLLGNVNPVSPPDDNVHVYAPQFADLASALAAVEISNVSYRKLNQGFAVACLAQWYTTGGTTAISPVLISTVPEATVITQDGTTPDPDMAMFDFLYQGARFYMSIIGSNSIPLESDSQDADLLQFGAALPSKVFSLIASESFANIIVGNAPDPYENETDPSTEDGGDGEDQDDDPVEEETLPVPSVAGHGFCTIYVPSAQELGQMSRYLWSGAFDVTQVIKLFSNPMDSILGLSAVPVSLSGTSEQIYLGGVALTGITMPKYTGRTSVKVDFGTATIGERWGSYLDYEPYTEFSIYLPFIGIKPLKADDIMGKTISLMYNIDILSGGCVAYIRPAGGSVLYEWSGQCALQIPVTARNYDNVFQTAMSVVGAVGAAVVAPASAPVLSGAVASAAVQAAATKPRIERSGSVNGITGFLGQLRPYIIRTIPEAFIPADQNKFIGYPAYINVALSEIRGYNEVDSIHLENVTATGAELEEIETILKGGVIF